MIERALRANEPPIERLLPSEARRIADARVAAGKIPSDPMHRVVDFSAPTPYDKLQMRLYRPAEHAVLPVVMYFHGGGFMLGGLHTHDALCRALASASQAAVVAVDFRRSPEHRFPAAADDCMFATRWVLEHAGELGVDAQRFAVAGESSGANLAAVVVQQLVLTKAPQPVLQALLLPVVELSTESPSYQRFGEGYLLTTARCRFYVDQYLTRPEEVRDPRASPLRAPSLAGLPPTFALAAGLDPTRSDAESYVEKLRAAGVPTEYTCYEGWPHPFLFWGETEASASAIAATGRALQAAFANARMNDHG
jgi:acetyl esterase